MFLDHTAKMGGGEVALLNLVRRLDPTRYLPIVVLFSDGPLTEKLRAAGVETHLVVLSGRVAEARKDGLGGGSLLRAKDAFATVGFLLRLARFIRRLKPDIVHTNSLKSDLLGGVAAKAAHVPVLWHVRDRIADDYLPPRVAWAFRFLARRLPDCVVANSAATLQTLSTDSQASVPDCMRVVHDGTPELSADDHDDSVTTDAPFPAPLIGLVGRIARWKGQHVFLRAAARILERFPQARFQVIGSPLFGEEDYEREIHRLAAELGIAGQVEFTGFRTDAPVLISRLDLLVHASITPEPFGQVIIEGMAAGKPVVATDDGGAREIVVPGLTGLLVPMADPKAMADAIESLLGDPGAARRMGQAGRQRVKDCFTMETVVSNVHAVYDHLLVAR